MLQLVHRLVVAVLLLAAWPALAQSDPPSRVGRLSYLDGDVRFQLDRRDEGGPATLNWPVSSGAVLGSGRHGRAEVWVGSTAYRLDADSELEFPVVDDRRVDVRLSGGSLAVSVLDRDQADDVQLTTPDGKIRFLTPGRYRINVHGDGSELLVQAGRATFDNGRRVIPVGAGQMLVQGSDGREQLDAARGYDGFDQWVAQRENASLAGTSRRHVSPHMTGYQDLDAYGDWRTAADYGAVWYPRAVASDWAPYRQGRWAWVAPWGWTWIDQAPWGFAPFHYGRWALIAGRWAWVPGRLVPRPVYAPALVGWVGNPGWSASFSFGSAPAVGWFPLAPREVYVPAYRYSPTYVRQINVTHVTNVTQIDRVIRGAPPAYAHHASPQAVTVVPTRQMQEGRPISAGDIRRHERRDLDRAPLARQAPSAQWVAPAPAAMRPHDGERGGQRPAGRDVEALRMPGAEREPFRDTGRGDRSRAVEAGLQSTDGRGRPADQGVPSQRQPMSVQGATRTMPDAGRNPAGDVRRENERRPGEAMPSMGTARQPDATPSAQAGRPAAAADSARDAANESRREFFRRQQEGRQDAPALQPDKRWNAQEREQRRDMREAQRMERPAQPLSGPASNAPRAQEATPASPPIRREMPPPEMRREERSQPAFQAPEREQRREMPREMPRMERPSQPQPAPVMTPQAMPQREMPRPAPEVRAPAPQPPAPPPRAEPPRQQPAQQGGNEQHRRRDEERGQR